MSHELIEAVTNNQPKVVLKLLMMGVDPNYAYGEKAITPLHIAAQNSSLEIITALVFAGANTQAITTDGHIPLQFARIHKQTKAENLLKNLMITDFSANDLDDSVVT